MALHVPKAPGISQMLKDGAKFFRGVDESVLRNIEATSQLSNSVKSAYGPNGMNKIIINHLEKLFVTSDAATIIKELEVINPAAKLIVQASQMQEQEVGDGTNFVIILAGALLDGAEELIRMGLTPVEIVEGYEVASKKALEILPSLICHKIKDYKNAEEVKRGIRTALMSKQYGMEDYLASLITNACISIMPTDGSFNVDNVRVCKILGSGILNSQVVQGMVFKRQVEGDVTKKLKAKIAVYTCPVDTSQTETKGTVLIKTAQELSTYTRDEENILESQIKAIVDTGANVIVSGGKFGDMAIHFLNKYGIMGVRLQSKFDLRRLCKTVGATALPKMVPPAENELGYCDNVYIDEIGETSVVIFKQDAENQSRISTIVVRGSTDNLMDDIERAVDDGVNTYKAITKDGRLVPGAGAVEMELSKQVASFGETLPGLEQYAVQKFAEALQAPARALADNSGNRSTEAMAALAAAHQRGEKHAGLNLDDLENPQDVVQAGILDLFLIKHWGIKYAVGAANTILQIDQIIMAKPAGGPKPKAGGGDWDAD